MNKRFLYSGELIDNPGLCQLVSYQLINYFKCSDEVKGLKNLRFKIITKYLDNSDYDCECLQENNYMTETGEPINDFDNFIDSKYNKLWCHKHRALHKVYHAIKRYSYIKRSYKLKLRNYLKVEK